jgi:TatD DNase family protein
MNFNYIDIHSHLNLPEFDADREEIIAKMKTEGVGTITVGVDYATSVSAVGLAGKHEHLYACVGVHPVDNATEVFDYDKFLALAQKPKVVAIGETGLDYFRLKDDSDKPRQKALFQEHIKLALETGKPLMIHARPSKGSMDAYDEVLDLLEKYKKDNPSLRANFHFFAGNKAVASRVVANAFTASFDGPITFTEDYDEVIRLLPIEHIMIETDSPFASPVPHRGKRCDPTMVRYIAEKIASVKGLSISEVIQTLFLNTKQTFDMKE